MKPRKKEVSLPSASPSPYSSPLLSPMFYSHFHFTSGRDVRCMGTWTSGGTGDDEYSSSMECIEGYREEYWIFSTFTDETRWWSFKWRSSKIILGIQGGTPLRPETYYCGIIDILQYYNTRKMGETVIKKAAGGDTDNIRCVDPETYYGKRFVKFISDLME